MPMSIEVVVLVGIVILGFVFVGFWLLRRSSDITYRPTAREMAATLQSLVDGRLTWAALDEFSCVRIAYNNQLDQLRGRCNAVLDQPEAFDKSIERGATAQLSESGRAGIREIIRELDTLAT